MENRELERLILLEQELNRKAIGELENLVEKRELGKITNAEYATGIAVLFSVCSGLVDSEFFALISKAAKETEKDYSFARTQILLGENDELVVIHNSSEKENFTFRRFDCEIIKQYQRVGKCDEYFTNLKNEAMTEKTIDSLVRNGFEQL